MIRWAPALAIASAVFGQSFEVASIHPADPKVQGMAVLCENGRVTIYSTTLRQLIQLAWKARDVEIMGGPGWIDSAQYYISAKGAGNANDAACRTMTQNLLMDRFQLLVHHEVRELPVYALVPAKSGPKLHESDASERVNVGPPPGGGNGFTAHKISIGNLALMLSRSMDHPVLDRTDLTGRYTFTLEWTPEGADGAGPSIFTAVEEQLGLKMENQRSPVDVLVIDRAVKPSEN